MKPKDQQPEAQELNEMKHLLRQSLRPLSPDQLEPRADLWPQLRARLESNSPTDRSTNPNRDRERTRGSVPWFDWALAALAAAALLLYPGIIPALLYHF